MGFVPSISAINNLDVFVVLPLFHAQVCPNYCTILAIKKNYYE